MAIEEFFEAANGSWSMLYLRVLNKNKARVEACCTWGCLNKNKASVSFRSTYTLDFNNSLFVMSDFENYETTFKHFLLHLRYSCNFCPNTCTQEAKLIKVSHLGVVILVDSNSLSHSLLP
jgi:hypothetical protein